MKIREEPTKKTYKSNTIPQGQVWPKIIQKIDAEILGIFFFQIFFCKVKKRILENIYKIWNLPRRDLPKKIIIWHQGVEPDLGVR